MDEVETLGRASGRWGETLLRRRWTGTGSVEELIVNGAFAMDSTETGTEVELAGWAVGRARVLIGGLGLGYTAAAALAGDVERLDVVELDPALIGWANEGVTPVLSRVAVDPRTHLWAEDIREVLAGAGPRGPWDAILLDVDNGPDFLLHLQNADLYAAAGLRTAYARLAPGGVLAIWCQGPSADLYRELRNLDADAGEHLFEVQRANRALTYAIYTVTSPG